MYPLEGWTPGTTLANYREIKFGNYIFPLTFQEQSRTAKLKADSRALPFGYGEYQDPNSSMNGRDVVLIGEIGTNLLGGKSGSTLVTATDLENERSYLGSLQAAGRQKLFVRSDRYCNAFLNEFTHVFLQDGGGFRFATWTLKFKADDPRYYATNPSVVSFTSTTPTIIQNGNMRAYPVITINGPVTNPTVTMIDGATGKTIAVTFTTTVASGDKIVLTTDPRPENRRIAALYVFANGTITNALQFITVPTGFANNLDASEIFPFINPNGNSTIISVTAGGNYSLSYNDTWL